MVTPKLSVIVPVYNTATYLRKCIDSLLEQTYDHLSIICINDGSTDESLSILQAYAAMDERIRIISQPNAGQAAARNAGLKAVETEFVTFLDADDYLERDAYAKAMALMEDGVDYVCFGTQISWGAYETMKVSDEKYYSIKFSGKVQVTTRVLDHTDASLWNKIFRKSLLDRYEISFPEGLRYEDAYFFKVYGIRSKYAAYTREKLHHYVRREDSTMGETFSGKSGRSLDHLKVSIKFYEYLKHHGILQEYMRFMGAFFFESYYFALRYESTQEGKEEIRRCAAEFFEREGITFSEFPDFHAAYMHVKRGELINRHTEKKWGGLLQIQRDIFRIKYFFCGLPLMRIKLREGYKKYYLFSLFLVKKVKFENVPHFPIPYTPPFVSVVLPVYQAEKTIAYTVRSILEQTHSQLELIIVNDGSTDATKDILQTFKDKRISVIQNCAHLGRENSTRTAIELAQGEYVAFASVKEYSLCDRLARQVHYLNTHEDVSIVGTSASEQVVCDREMASEVKMGSLMMRRSLITEQPHCLDVLLGEKTEPDCDVAIADLKELLIIEK